MTPTHPRPHLVPRAWAFSFAETAASILLVAVLLVVALNTLGDVTVSQQNMSDRGVGSLLAQDLIGEILRRDYEDPDGSPVFGVESGEATISRADFDDVDDYQNWTASPPQEKDGTVIPDRVGWRRTVMVAYAQATDVSKTALTNQGIKRITVTVEHNAVEVASLVAVRTSSGTWMTEDPIKQTPETPPVEEQ